jgi:hypothetical protein
MLQMMLGHSYLQRPQFGDLLPEDLVLKTLSVNDLDTLRCIIERYLKSGPACDPTIPTVEQWSEMNSNARRIHEVLRVGGRDERSAILEAI